MIEILEPLSHIPGVRYAGLVTDDGVPILLPGRPDETEHSASREHNALEMDVNVLAAIAYQWFIDLVKFAGELTWDNPVRGVLKAARGTLVVRTVKGGVLLALLDPGTGAEELRLPMEGAAARVQRVLRSMGGQVDPIVSAPPSPLPAGSGLASQARSKDKPQSKTNFDSKSHKA